jgi:hypothetical protein
VILPFVIVAGFILGICLRDDLQDEKCAIEIAMPPYAIENYEDAAS